VSGAFLAACTTVDDSDEDAFFGAVAYCIEEAT
jgi:hypothetical protein